MKKNTESLFSFVLLVIGIVVVTMIFLPVLTLPNSDLTFLGYEVVFGTKFTNLNVFHIVWSFWGVLAYMIPLLASIVAIYLKKSSIISLILFILGAVLLFTMPLYTKTTITFMGAVREVDIDWSISFGLIIAIILSTFGAFLCLYKLVYKNNFKK